MRVGVYPGTFNPPTVAHLAIAEAARDQCRLDRVDLVVSRTPLGKEDHDLVDIDDRLTVLHALTRQHDWLGATVSDRRLIAELATGYDVVVLGADKFAQVVDPIWYDDDTDARDEIVRSLPTIACAPRPGSAIPVIDGTVVLDVHDDHAVVSATAVRDGRHDWMVPEARAFAERTGAWIDDDRYRSWRARTSARR